MERFIEPVFFYLNSSIVNLFKSTIFLFVFNLYPVRDKNFVNKKRRSW